MKVSEREYEKARAYLRAKLSQPEPQVEQWLNSIVDAWEAKRRTVRRKATRRANRSE